MSGRSLHSLTQTFDAETLEAPRSPSRRFFAWLPGRLERGELTIETPGGTPVVFTGRHPGPQARLIVHSWRFLLRLVSGWDVGFAEAYMAGEVSSPNLVALLALASRNRGMTRGLKVFRHPRVGLKLRHTLNRNTRRGSRRNIAAHYDLGNAFFQPWLDAGMTYSSALFCSAGQSLEEGQQAKFDRVLDLLELQDGDRVLEIGCGWGSLGERLLEEQSCSFTGVTLSTEQLAFARQRLSDHVAAGRCDLRLQDYRDISGTFDRVVSIEMLEAVGAAYWPTYFAKLRDSLRPGGTAVLQVITIDEGRFDNYRRRPDFIQKYIFPGGMLPTKRIISDESLKAGLQPVHSESFGLSYARTLEQWNNRFQRAWPQIRSLGYDNRFGRMWEYYLGYCQAGFEIGALDVGLYKIVRAP